MVRRTAVVLTYCVSLLAGCAALERPLPEEILLLPVHLNDRLIAVLYGEGTQEQSISVDVEDYLHLVSKISMALNIIILKMKIRVG